MAQSKSRGLVDEAQSRREYRDQANEHMKRPELFRNREAETGYERAQENAREMREYHEAKAQLNREARDQREFRNKIDNETETFRDQTESKGDVRESENGAQTTNGWPAVDAGDSEQEQEAGA